MSFSVYINDERLDLKANVGIGLTFQVGSILNPSTRAGNLSNRFTVPKTQNNTRILGNLLNINSSTEIPYKRSSAKVVQNGVEIFTDGFAIVEGLSKMYSVTVYSGNVSFFDLIKGKNISDLIFGSTHFSITPIIETFDGSKDFIYPIVDWGLGVDLLDNTNTQNIDALFPLLFVESIMNKMLDDIGYTLGGTFKDKEFYSRLLLGINKFGFSKEVAEATSGKVDTPTLIDTTLDGDPINTPANYVDFPIVYNNNTAWQKYSILSNEFVPDNTFKGLFQLDVSGTLKNLQGTPSASTWAFIKTELLEDGVVIYSEISPPLYMLDSGAIKYYDVLFYEDNLTAFKGKSYTVNLSVFIRTPGATIDAARFTVNESIFRFTANQEIRYLADIEPSTFYDYKQDDFLKSLMNMYSLTIQTDNTQKILYLNSLNDVTENIDKAIDWSDIVNPAKTITVKYKLGSYAQENNLSYKADDDVDGDFANGTILVDNTNLSESKDLITVNTVAVNDTRRVVNSHTPKIPIQEEIGKPFDKKNTRFLLLDSKNQTVNFKTSTVEVDYATANTDIPFCYFRNTEKDDNLDFPSLIDTHYSTLVGMLDQVKFVSAYFRLKEIDIANLDFGIPIFLDVHNAEVHINGYFYINKISNFKENSSTKVDLIRL